jgi:hypothetical protein
MPLPASDYAALQASIAANTNQVTFINDLNNQVTEAINVINVADGNGCNAIAAYYNGFPATPFYGNYNNVPIALIADAVRWARFYPSDAVTASNYTQIILACNQMLTQLQDILSTATANGGFFDATQKLLVNGLKAATDAVPSAGAGATQDAGWLTAPSSPAGSLTIQQTICRLATIVEQLFADTSLANGSTNLLAATLIWEGPITGQDVQNAVNQG